MHINITTKENRICTNTTTSKIFKRNNTIEIYVIELY